jgi:hypothetical protein
MLSREQIFAAPDIKTEKVDVPEWGGHVFVRVMNGYERQAFEEKQQELKLHSFRERLAVTAICDESGKLLFTPADVEALRAKSSGVLTRIADVVLKLNGIGPSAVEAAEKNSESTRSDSSVSS